MVTIEEFNKVIKDFKDMGGKGLTADHLISAIDLFRKNDFFKEYYDNAPSDNCQKYIALEFCYSLYYVLDEDLMNQIEGSFDLEDWKHLYRYCANNPLKGKYHRKIKELSSLD